MSVYLDGFRGVVPLPRQEARHGGAICTAKRQHEGEGGCKLQGTSPPEAKYKHKTSRMDLSMIV
jgi:hypothetical protein